MKLQLSNCFQSRRGKCKETTTLGRRGTLFALENAKNLVFSTFSPLKPGYSARNSGRSEIKCFRFTWVAQQNYVDLFNKRPPPPTFSWPWPSGSMSSRRGRRWLLISRKKTNTQITVWLVKREDVCYGLYAIYLHVLYLQTQANETFVEFCEQSRKKTHNHILTSYIIFFHFARLVACSVVTMSNI